MSTDTVSGFEDVERATLRLANHLLGKTPLKPFAPVLGHWFTHDLERAYRNAGDVDEASFFPKLLSTLNIQWECSPEQLARIPRTGPVIVVSNHPFGLMEG